MENLLLGAFLTAVLSCFGIDLADEQYDAPPSVCLNILPANQIGSMHYLPVAIVVDDIDDKRAGFKIPSIPITSPKGTTCDIDEIQEQVQLGGPERRSTGDRLVGAYWESREKGRVLGSM